MTDVDVDQGPIGGSLAVAPRIRWFRKWWALLPIMLIVVALAHTAAPVLALVPFIVLMALYWTGPVTQGFKARKVVSKKSKAFLTVLALGFIIFQIARNDTRTDRLIREASIPGCDSEQAEQLFKNVVKNSPAGRTQGLELLGLKDVGQVSWNNADEVRRCQGMVFTNAGREPALWEMRWWDRSKAMISLEVIK
jgi:hypothetical protein